MLKRGLMKADSGNLPRVDTNMVYEYIKDSDLFDAEEMRGAKTSRSSCVNYGDSVVGYVCLKRIDSLCVVEAKICPQHRVTSKKYPVTLTVDQGNETVISVKCDGCPASLSGCKHSIAFLMWVNRKTENPSPTDVQCYWKKPRLAQVGFILKFVIAKNLLCTNEKDEEENRPDNSTFLMSILKTAKEKQLDSQLSRRNLDLDERKLYCLSIHQILILFSSQGKTSVDDFLEFATSKMEIKMCLEAAQKSKLQSDNLLWFELRYARITASKLYEAAHCKTSDGSFVRLLTGSSKVFETEFMRRGKVLEKIVLERVKKLSKINFDIHCGLYLIPSMPFVGASPDAIGENFVVEVKRLGTDKGFDSFLPKGKPEKKMRSSNEFTDVGYKQEKSLFCVADPKYESNKKVFYTGSISMKII